MTKKYRAKNNQIKPINPVHWRLSVLLSIETEAVHSLALRAAGTLTSYRVVLGRCLLAMKESKGYRDFGCSGAVHYACAVLGLSVREARDCIRVARTLLGLPRLSREAEEGRIAWGKLREIVRKAGAETEALWIELAKRYSDTIIQSLVSRTPKGSVPGEVSADEDSYKCERCPMNPQVFQMLEQARRAFSLECNEVVTTAQVLEWTLVAYLSQNHFSNEALQKVREEADRDLQAERARRLPIVQKARELAAEMGVLEEQDKTTRSGRSAEQKECCEEEPDSLTTGGAGPVKSPSIGANADDGKSSECGTSDRASREHCECSEKTVGSEVADRWKNQRLRFNPRARLATRGQRTEILRRDGWCCSTPGCPNRIWLQVHHLKRYAEGGKTLPENLLGLCSGCHRNHHRGRLRIAREGEKLVFRDGNGHRLDKQADLELAGWLNRELGWKGSEDDCYRRRFYRRKWGAYSI